MGISGEVVALLCLAGTLHGETYGRNTILTGGCVTHGPRAGQDRGHLVPQGFGHSLDHRLPVPQCCRLSVKQCRPSSVYSGEPKNL